MTSCNGFPDLRSSWNESVDLDANRDRMIPLRMPALNAVEGHIAEGAADEDRDGLPSLRLYHIRFRCAITGRPAQAACLAGSSGSRARS
jgi:hypothetical protein